jgi:FtsX-like permease family
MGVVWRKAPFVLRRHPAVLAAVLVLSGLVALAASSPPLVRAGVASDALKQRLRDFSPLAAGLEVSVPAAPTKGDPARRRAAERFGRSLPELGRPVLSSLFDEVVDEGGGNVVLLARSGVRGHVHLERRVAGNGVWIADSTATPGHIEPGDVITLGGPDEPHARVRVVGIYRRLTTVDAGSAYWANWVQDIRSVNPDSIPPPPFMLVPPALFERLARELTPAVENRFEYPVDPHGITLTGARRLLQRFDGVEAVLRSPAGLPLGCGRIVPCTTSSLLQATLTLTAVDVAGVSPTISLLADCGLAIALALACATGVFLVRRRRDEAHVHFVRGEPASVFAARTALEALLPAAAGGALGLGAALAVLSAVAPGGAIAGDTISAAAWRAAAGAGAAVLAIAAGAGASFPRRAATGSRISTVLPWELAPLAGAAALLAVVLAGGGLVHDSTGIPHPRLEVFVVPVLAATGIAGLVVRGGRRLLRRAGAPRLPVLFLALRRLGAARGLLVAVFVATAAAAGTFAYAATLSASISRSTAEKAYVANGSDVQGFVDPHFTVLRPFSFPVALVEIDTSDATLPDGTPVDVIAGDGAALARTLHGWSRDPRPLLRRLTGANAIGTPGFPSTDAIVDQGVRIPVHVIGRTVLPGATAGRPALLVPRSLLERRRRLVEPVPSATGLVWARGPSRLVEQQLLASSLLPVYLTTPSHILDDPSVAAAERSYRYIKVIAIAAAVLSLLALVLYLQARQQGQLIATALTRRMGLKRRDDLFALALEAACIVGAAAVVGCAVAASTARPIVHRVDPLSLYAPAAQYVVPWTTLVAGIAAGMAVASLLGALAVAAASRSDVAKALRVA